jgi:hypothetical protein
MGMYVIRHLKRSVLKDGKDLQIFANDFCANSKEAVKERLLFINEIYTISQDSDLFI